ncbi:MAG: zinc ribbon domain-containing protein [Oscillospiraceae bacterium]|nr:zinc ribbon domain-containing protein [Oscillospiraceae bacterium]
MAFCSNCGKELAAGDKFCSECGTPVRSASTSERKIVYDGELHKCPNCGGTIKSFEINCPTCGYELRGAKNSDSVREFANKLEKIEQSRSSKSSGLKKLLKNGNGVNETDKEKISLIRSFVIPNTKEDLFEFMILASSNINMHRYSNLDSISESEKAVSDAWEAKFEQAYEKAKLSFGDSQEFKKMHNLYTKKNGEIRRSKSKRIYLWIGLIVGYIAIFGVLFGLVGSTDRKIDKENARLEAIVEEVYAALEEEDYVLARAKAATLTFSGPNTTSAESATEKWDKTREELLAVIDAAENGESDGIDY